MSGSPFLSQPIGDIPPERTGRMAKVCAWCDTRMGETPCEPSLDGEVTHGICAACAARQLRDLTGDSFAPINPNERTTMPAPAPRSALALRDLMRHLSDHCQAVIYRTEHAAMTHGEHHVWRHGAMAYTAAGLRVLADAFDQERNSAAALVCRRGAERLDALDAQPPALPAATAELKLEHDAWETLERRRLA